MTANKIYYHNSKSPWPGGIYYKIDLVLGDPLMLHIILIFKWSNMIISIDNKVTDKNQYQLMIEAFK